MADTFKNKMLALGGVRRDGEQEKKSKSVSSWKYISVNSIRNNVLHTKKN